LGDAATAANVPAEIDIVRVIETTHTVTIVCARLTVC
jgi:hypothetical protein